LIAFLVLFGLLGMWFCEDCCGISDVTVFGFLVIVVQLVQAPTSIWFLLLDIIQPLLCFLPSHESRENVLISISRMRDFGKNNIKVYIL
jgi:hypothetical protein